MMTWLELYGVLLTMGLICGFFGMWLGTKIERR
jgi:hypothetical protein